MPPSVDLHVHSTTSDGTDSPAALVDLAIAGGLCTLALTDHDTTAGLPEFLDRCRTRGFPGIPGIEISADFEGRRLHLVGLGVLPGRSHEIEALLAKARTWRDERNLRMVAGLNRLGIPITLDQLAAEAGGAIFSRAHFSSLLVRNGLARDTADSFRRFIGQGAPAYVPKQKIDAASAIRVVHAAGAVAVAAHPNTLLHRPDEPVAPLLAGLAALGADAVEAWHPDIPPALSRDVQQSAHAQGLLLSAGSDYHGLNKPEVRLGHAADGEPIDAERIQPLLARLRNLGFAV